MKRTIFSNTVAKALTNFGGANIFSLGISDWDCSRNEHEVCFTMKNPSFYGTVLIQESVSSNFGYTTSSIIVFYESADSITVPLKSKQMHLNELSSFLSYIGVIKLDYEVDLIGNRAPKDEIMPSGIVAQRSAR